MQSLNVFHQSVSPYIPWGVLTRREDIVPLKRRGFAASPGIVEGPCTIVRNPEDLHSLHDGAGLGGPHCIAAGYAREQEVPAVVGVGNLMEAIHTGDVIRIDGSSGTVEIVG